MEKGEIYQLINNGKYKEAHCAIDKELTKNLTFGNCVLKISAFIHEKKYEEAYFFTKKNETILSNYVKGIIYYKAKNYNEAIKPLEKSLSEEVVPQKVSALLALINSY